MTTTLIIIALIAMIAGFIGYKLWSANREVEQILKVNANLEQKNKQQALEIETKKAEIKYAQIKQENTNKASRSNASSIDQQLHQHQWFRDEDGSLGLSGISQNLSKPSRHDGDEASDSGSQSDSSGDL
ncbi:DUF2681 domain-containing protein [Histophilus somni]|uniref:DUF2681 domain-containing protein n=1 Tax=Histophilus somni TaxID=731 RepID=UPI00094B2F7B|nr:DUF2681 domain-containing protein [Histophilus somni]THA21146.1 DUF2681 domain-containing protein [Histophilus somni]